MKAITLSVILCALTWNIGTTCVYAIDTQQTQNKAAVQEVDIAFVQAALKKKKDLKSGKLVIVDARTSEYLMKGAPMIPGAINIPHDADKDLILKTLPDKDAHILIYCGGVMCPAGTNLANRLIESGYTKVSDFRAGMKAWQDAGLTTQQNGVSVKKKHSARKP